MSLWYFLCARVKYRSELSPAPLLPICALELRSLATERLRVGERSSGIRTQVTAKRLLPQGRKKAER